MIDFSLSEEQRALTATARRFTKERILPIAKDCDRAARFPMHVLEEAFQLGLINPTCPAAYGGAGLGELENTLITEELAYGCTGIQTSLLVNTLFVTAVKLAGTEEQKRKYLGLLTSAPICASFATTEPEAGSDVAGIKTRFTRHGDAFVLNGQKAWITNANLSQVFVVFATSNPEARHKGIAAFVVERDFPGFRVGKKEDKLGQRASDTAPIFLDEVVVPKDNLLAPEGKGFKLAMETFNETRPAIGASAVGLMRRCVDECVAYAKERKTFGQPIAEHQMVQSMIADMAIRVEATRLLSHKAALQLDQGTRDPLVSSFAKAFGGDSAMQTAVDAVQIFGANGYSTEYPVEKLMRDAKVLQIYEGTSQIQRLVIARQLLSS